jgi:hypothetical protein
MVFIVPFRMVATGARLVENFRLRDLALAHWGD